MAKGHQSKQSTPVSQHCYWITSNPWICIIAIFIFLCALSVPFHLHPINTMLREKDGSQSSTRRNIQISPDNITSVITRPLPKALRDLRPAPRERIQNMTKSNILMVFLHFHKAGGTSIASAAGKNRNLFKPNINGNPFEPNKKRKIPFWTFSREKLVDFWSHILKETATRFIATENNWFRDTVFMDDAFKKENGVEFVTQLRDPFSRFISNYFFDVYKTRKVHESRNIKKKSLIERLRVYHSMRWRYFKFNATNDWNMYVRVLSNKFEQSYNVTEYDLEIAKRELDKFDLVTVLERSDGADLWESKYGIIIKHANTLGSNKYDKIYSAEKQKDRDFEQKWSDFQEEFRRLNRFDYELYQYAVELHKQFVVQG